MSLKLWRTSAQYLNASPGRSRLVNSCQAREESSWQAISRSRATTDPPRRHITTNNVATEDAFDGTPSIDVNRYDHLNPQPPDFTSTPFTDSCKLTITSGAGGHGCISFLREMFVANGPPNGGDGGTGGNVWIQAVRGETSLHKVARRRIVKAGRGRNGQGGLRGGKRGEDIIITVPVGTVVRELDRHDPVAEELAQHKRTDVGLGKDAEAQDDGNDKPDQMSKWRRDKWLLYPGALPKHFTTADYPPLPRPRRSNLVLTAASAPVALDLDKPMNSPILLAAGAMGGLGNPHFVTKSITRPKYATKGDDGTNIQLQLELKLLADVGLVGLPNAGKSTLLRALTSSRARVGSWAFTTLAPNIGTVVLDASSGPAAQTRRLHDPVTGEVRTHFTIADIPGLIKDAHQDKGLGLDFLRHIERAAVLAFVVDLSAGDAVSALDDLWTELRQYDAAKQEQIQIEENKAKTYEPFTWQPESVAAVADVQGSSTLPPLSLPPITTKPWLVIATKADLPETQDNFLNLTKYLAQIQASSVDHPSGNKEAWRDQVFAVPVCAQQKQNTQGVLDGLLALLSHNR